MCTESDQPASLVILNNLAVISDIKHWLMPGSLADLLIQTRPVRTAVQLFNWSYGILMKLFINSVQLQKETLRSPLR